MHAHSLILNARSSLILIPARQWFGPRWFTEFELSVLDAPVANSHAVIASIGGDLREFDGRCCFAF